MEKFYNILKYNIFIGPMWKNSKMDNLKWKNKVF